MVLFPRDFENRSIASLVLYQRLKEVVFLHDEDGLRPSLRANNNSGTCYREQCFMFVQHTTPTFAIYL